MMVIKMTQNLSFISFVQLMQSLPAFVTKHSTRKWTSLGSHNNEVWLLLNFIRKSHQWGLTSRSQDGYSMPSSRLSASPQLNRQSRLGGKKGLFGFLWFYQQFERLWNFGNLNSKYSPVYMLMVGWEGKSFLEFCLKKMKSWRGYFKKTASKKTICTIFVPYFRLLID